MYIRCLDCKKSTMIEPSVAGSVQEVTCGTCGKSHTLKTDPTVSVRQHYERAQEFARTNGIDLPSAYSVLMGIMTLEQACRLQEDKEAPTNSSLTARKSTPAPTSQQPRRSGRVPTWNDLRSFDLPPGRRIVVTIFAVLAILLAGIIGSRLSRPAGRSALPVQTSQRVPIDPAADRDPVRTHGIEILRDDSSGVVGIRAMQASAVLAAFCAADPDAGRNPIRVATDPQDAAARLGLFRADDEPGTRYIRIERDPNSGGWIAGDGDTTLVSFPAIDAAADGSDAPSAPPSVPAANPAKPSA